MNGGVPLVLSGMGGLKLLLVVGFVQGKGAKCSHF